MFVASCPSHISGFFEIVESNGALIGSRGGGIVLERGVKTEVQIGENEIIIDGKKSDAPTTRYVVERLAKQPVRVVSSFDVPIGCGFGASAAGALSTAMAINGLFSLGLDVRRVAEVAHQAELANRTGLGDVAAIVHGGVVVRTQPGIIGSIFRINAPERICWVVLGGKSTASVLSDRDVRRDVNRAGRKAIKQVIKNPNFQNFMHACREFAIECGLVSDRILGIIEEAESNGIVLGVAMIGETLFGVGCEEFLSNFGNVQSSRIRTSPLELPTLDKASP